MANINLNTICNDEIKVDFKYSPIKRTLTCDSPLGDFTFGNITTYGEILDAVTTFISECYYYEP